MEKIHAVLETQLEDEMANFNAEDFKKMEEWRRRMKGSDRQERRTKRNMTSSHKVNFKTMVCCRRRKPVTRRADNLGKATELSKRSG